MKTLWPAATFEEALVDVTRGHPKIAQAEYQLSGDFPIIDQGKNLIGGFTSDISAVSTAELPVIIFGDHTKCIKFVDFQFCAGADGVKILQAQDGFNPRYLFHFLRTVNLPEAGYSRHFKYLRDISIPLPPMDEQRRIASILDTAEALRAKRRQALEKLNFLTQSIFINMFGSIDKRIKLLDLLSDADLFTDGDWVESKDQDPEGGVRLTQLADVGVGQWINKSRRFMTSERAKALKCTYLQAGDVLVARMPDPIGRACLFPGDPMPAVTAVDVCIIRPDQQKLSARWLVEALNLPSTRRQVEALAVGATRQRVSRGNLGKVELPEVELPDQRLFVERADRIDKLRLRSALALDETERLFASLQHQAFRGEL
jgi:type I restriction enzyme S subunit